jgi:hypothetical protein
MEIKLGISKYSEVFYRVGSLYRGLAKFAIVDDDDDSSSNNNNKKRRGRRMKDSQGTVALYTLITTF